MASHVVLNNISTGQLRNVVMKFKSAKTNVRETTTRTRSFSSTNCNRNSSKEGRSLHLSSPPPGNSKGQLEQHVASSHHNNSNIFINNKNFPLQRVFDWEKKAVFKVVGIFARSFIQYCTRFETYNEKALKDAIKSGRPLITITNHDSTMDDPLLYGILDKSYFSFEMEDSRIRWTLCAQEICFGNDVQSRFFSAGQGIPVVRGDGIHQPGMDEAVNILNENGWIHLFPEGKVNETPEKLLPLKWGVARLVRDSKEPPLVLPFYHHGMADILPTTSKTWNRLYLNKQLDVMFSGVALDFSRGSLLKLWQRGRDSTILDEDLERGIRVEIMKVLDREMETLKRRTIALAQARKDAYESEEVVEDLGPVDALLYLAKLARTKIAASY